MFLLVVFFYTQQPKISTCRNSFTSFLFTYHPSRHSSFSHIGKMKIILPIADVYSTPPPPLHCKSYCLERFFVVRSFERCIVLNKVYRKVPFFDIETFRMEHSRDRRKKNTRRQTTTTNCKWTNSSGIECWSTTTNVEYWFTCLCVMWLYVGVVWRNGGNGNLLPIFWLYFLFPCHYISINMYSPVHIKQPTYIASLARV